MSAEQCAAVHAAAVPALVTNTTFRLAPWADMLIGFDLRWWKEYHAEVAATFAGRRISFSQHCGKYGVETLANQPWATGFHNSGALAIQVAARAGAKKIILLGYDCRRVDGAVHWHGNHPEGMSNAESMRHWPRMFERLAKVLEPSKVDIVNCSPVSALECFRRGELEQELR